MHSEEASLQRTISVRRRTAPGSVSLCLRAGRISGEQFAESIMADQPKKKPPLENAPSKKPDKKSGKERGNAEPQQPKKK